MTEQMESSQPESTATRSLNTARQRFKQRKQANNHTHSQSSPHQFPAPLPMPIRPLSRSSGLYPGAANVSNRTAGGRKMQSADRLRRKYQKPAWYHKVAAKNRLGSIHEDAFAGEEDESEKELETSDSDSPKVCACTRHAKEALLEELNRTGGESNTPAFHDALQKLVQQYDASRFDPRKPAPRYYTPETAGRNLEGVGIAAGKPTFAGCIGRNDQGDAMYKLGAMTFGMFGPASLVVSVQGTFVLIDVVDGRNPNGVKNVPQNLLADVRFGRSPVRSYDLVTPITIEPWKPEFGDGSPNRGIGKPIRGVLTSFGFIHPYPTQNRFSVWFTGGSLEVDNTKNEKWFQTFDKDKDNTTNKRTEAEAEQLQAAMKLLTASNNNNEMDSDGKLTYSLTNPQSSHIDLLYLDNTLQVLRGSSGTVYVHVRLPGSKAVQDSVRSDGLLPAPADPLSLDASRREQEKENRHNPLALEFGNSNILFAGASTRRRQSFKSDSRNSQSTSNLLDLAESSQGSSGADARLRELQSFGGDSNIDSQDIMHGNSGTRENRSFVSKAAAFVSRGFKKAKPHHGVAGVA